MLVCAELGQKITVGGQESSGDSTRGKLLQRKEALRDKFVVTDADYGEPRACTTVPHLKSERMNRGCVHWTLGVCW